MEPMMTRTAESNNLLARHIPVRSVDRTMELLEGKNVHVKITRARFSKVGDYGCPLRQPHHRISVNGDLNPYAFLITLVHEIAHMHVWSVHGTRARGHGREWKEEFGNLLTPFLQTGVFPNDIDAELERHLRKPRASTLSDVRLQAVLNRYDPFPRTRLTDLESGSRFRLKNKRDYVKLGAAGKFCLCRQLSPRRMVKIHPLAEVEIL
jgi:SprT protein